MKTAIGLALAGMVFGGAAFAADATFGPATTWNGFYVGGNLGYGTGAVTLSNVLSGVPPTTPSTYGSSFAPQGVFGGGQVGFNLQSERVVLGVEADIQASGISATNVLNDEAKLEYFGTVRARLGYTVGRLLPYVTGGFAYGKGRGTLNYTSPVVATFSDDAVHTGWALGAGAEYAVSDHLSLKAEYLHVDLASRPYDFDYATADVSYAFDAVRVGFNFRY